MSAICVLLAALFAWSVLAPAHTTYQVIAPAPAVATSTAP